MVHLPFGWTYVLFIAHSRSVKLSLLKLFERVLHKGQWKTSEGYGTTLLAYLTIVYYKFETFCNRLITSISFTRVWDHELYFFGRGLRDRDRQRWIA